MLDENGAEGRTDDRGDAEDTRDVALHPRALGRRVDVAHDGGGDRLDGAGAESLQRAQADEDRHRPGEAAQCGGDEEHARAGEEHPLASVEVGEAAVDRDAHGLSEQVGGEHPAEQGEAAEIADDRGHGRGDDGAFDRRHEDGHHRGGEDEGPSRRCLRGRVLSNDGGFQRGGLRTHAGIPVCPQLPRRTRVTGGRPSETPAGRSRCGSRRVRGRRSI